MRSVELPNKSMNENPPSAVENGQTAPPVIEPGKPQEPRPEQRPRRRIWPWLLVLVIAGVAVYYYISRPKQPSQPSTAAITTQVPGARHGRGGGGVPPVVAVKAFKGDIGVYYTGLGAVTPIFTVTVKSRVDGQLMQVLYKEGQMVKEGEPLVEIDPRPYQATLTQYEGALVRDEALLANARVDLKRYEDLIGRKAVPEQTLATQRALVEQDEGTVKTDQGQIDAAKLNLVYCHITAPISGRLGLRLVDPGNFVQAASLTALAVITQVDPISVIFTLSEDQLGQVAQRFNHGARLRVDAYDHEMNRKMASGTLSTIDNQIDQTTGTVKLRAVFDNPGGKLFPNQFVNAKLLVQEKRGVLLLQNAAIQRNSKSTYVFLVKPDNTVTIKQVQLGTSDGENTEITSGLEAGDVVVMTGVDKLQEGSKVQVHMENEQAPAQSEAPSQPRGAGQ